MRDPVATFLYLLMKNELVPDAVHDIIAQMEDDPHAKPTNIHLFRHADEVATRLRALAGR